MANRLKSIPTSDITWFLQCKYCQTIPTRNRHELELLEKARKLCKHHHTNHFLDYVTSELDTLDHAKLTPITMIEILVEIHDSLPCDCLTGQTQEIDALTKDLPTPEQPPIPAVPTSPPTQKTQSKKHPKTLLERLKNGSSEQQKT